MASFKQVKPAPEKAAHVMRAFIKQLSGILKRTSKGNGVHASRDAANPRQAAGAHSEVREDYRVNPAEWVTGNLSVPGNKKPEPVTALLYKMNSRI